MKRISLYVLAAGIAVLALCSQKRSNPFALSADAFAPAVHITAPGHNDEYSPGDSISLQCRVVDADQDVRALRVYWRSDRDGALASATPDSNGNAAVKAGGLSYNVHVLTASVTDRAGNTASDTVRILYNIPPAPVLDSIIGDTSGASLRWSRATVSDFASYAVYRSTSRGVDRYDMLVATLTGVDDTVFTDSTVYFGTELFYRVYVVNGSDLAGGSNEKSIEFTNVRAELQSPIIHAVMHPSGPWVFLLSESDDALYRVNYRTGAVDTVSPVGSASDIPKRLTIYDTGAGVELYVSAVTQNYSTNRAETDQSGYVLVYDADNPGASPERIPLIGTDPYAVVNGGDGYLYVSSGSRNGGYYSTVKSYSRSSGGTAADSYSSIYPVGDMQKHPTLDRLYTVSSYGSYDAYSLGISSGTISYLRYTTYGGSCPHFTFYEYSSRYYMLSSYGYTYRTDGTDSYYDLDDYSDNIPSHNHSTWDADNRYMYVVQSGSRRLNRYNGPTSFYSSQTFDTEHYPHYVFLHGGNAVMVVTPYGTADFIYGLEVVNVTN